MTVTVQTYRFIGSSRTGERAGGGYAGYARTRPIHDGPTPPKPVR